MKVLLSRSQKGHMEDRLSNYVYEPSTKWGHLAFLKITVCHFPGVRCFCDFFNRMSALVVYCVQIVNLHCIEKFMK
jgi:hypothetical protein